MNKEHQEKKECCEECRIGGSAINKCRVCPCHSPKNEKWEIEFEKEFDEWLYGSGLMAINHGYPQFEGKRTIKEFIKDTLSSSRHKLIEEIKETAERYKLQIFAGVLEGYGSGYRNALSDLIAYLETKK